MVLATALLAATLFVVVPAQPASAALPTCNHFRTTRHTDGFGYTYYRRTPASSASGTRNCRLSLGDSGWGVWALQHSLNACNGGRLKEDGKYGPLTRNMVIWVQASHGRAADGVYGPATGSGAMLWPQYAKTRDGKELRLRRKYKNSNVYPPTAHGDGPVVCQPVWW